MGSCWCKEKTLGFEGSITEVTSGPEDVYGDATNILPGIIAPDYFFHGDKGCPDSHTVDELIRETLGVIGTLVDKLVFIFLFYYHHFFIKNKLFLCFMAG